MKFLKHSTAFFLGFLLLAGAAFAQGQQMQQTQPDSNVTDQELKQLADFMQKRQKIQRASQKKVQAMLSDKKMTMQRFQKIMMSKRNPKMADSVKVTPTEQKTIKEIQPTLKKLQKNSRKQMMKIMKNSGLTQKKLQSIMRAVRSNPEVMKRFKKISKKNSGNN